MLKKIILYSVVIYAILGFIVTPLVLKPQIIDIIQKETNSKISIESIFLNPFIFKLDIEGITLSSLEDKELVHLKSISLNLEPSSLYKAAIHVKSLVLEEPRISLVLNKDKQINFASIVKTTSDSKEQTNEEFHMPRIILDRVAIVDGSLNYEDYSNKSKFDFSLDNIGFELKNIDTQDIDSKDANIRFYTQLSDGGFIDFKSEILSYAPFKVKGSLDFEASKLYTQWRYMRDSLNLEVADGKLSIHTDYYFNIEDLDLTTLSNLNVDLERLRIKPKGDYKDVLNLKSLSIKDATIKPIAQNIHSKKIQLDSLYAKVDRDKKGDIDWLEYIKIASDNNKTKENIQDESSKKTKPWYLLVDKVALEKIKLDFNDNGVQPMVKTSLNELNIYAKNITLLGEEPIKYQMNLLLNDKLKCSSEGSVAHKVLDIKSQTKCSDFDVVHYKPYIDEIASSQLKVYDLKLRSLVAGFDANVTLQDINSSLVVDVSGANVNLSKFAINKKSTNKRLATFSDFDINGLTLNTQTKEVGILDTTLKHLNIRTSRLKNGSIDVQNLVVPHANKKIKKKKSKKKEKDYRVKLKKVALKAAKVSFKDEVLTPSVANKIDNIYLSAYNIDSKKYSWLKYYLSARVNSSGKIKASGNLRHTPLKEKGKLEVNKISLKDLTPYIQEKAHVSVEDGYVSLKTKTSYAKSKIKPDLSLDGSFKLGEFFANDSRDKSSLISFNDINLKKFTLELSPDRLFVNEVDVNSFYVNAIVDENKTMNFATLVKAQEDDAVAVVDTNVTDDNKTIAEPFPVKIMKVNVAYGSAHFSDASLPIHFKTNIHDLNGVIYAISSLPNETSYVDIVGEVDRYGSTKLKGSINASSPKSYTDLDFNFRNLDLSAMSGYSSSFAGYKIDNGKLFLDLNYDILESKLSGENSIIIKNMELGDELKVEGGSSLPLGFVIALLEDDEGVIDIDMPIRGNVDEPDFKYGALIWKTFGNLILKAVTSPFRFLGAMMGIDGEKLEYAEFEGGSLVILPPEQEKLDKISKLMMKRPKISLSVSGGYDINIDKESMQRIKLANLIVKLSGAKNEEERINAMNIDLLEDIYEDARDDDKLDKIEDALEDKYDDKDVFKRAYLQALIKECSLIQEVSEFEMKELAKQRSSAIKSYLVDNKGIDALRVKEVDISVVQNVEKKLVKSKLELVIK
ncbi:DUF748 domain-containing protein [Sulfurimonas sp.]